MIIYNQWICNNWIVDGNFEGKFYTFIYTYPRAGAN